MVGSLSILMRYEASYELCSHIFATDTTESEFFYMHLDHFLLSIMLFVIV